MAKYERVLISSLSLDPINARKHNARNLEAIKGSLARFGQQKPIVIDKNNVVIAGNGTLEAARELGWSEIDVSRSDLEGFDKAAYALADNRTSELADWDEEILRETLVELKKNDFDIEMLDFDIDISPVGFDESKEDDVPEVKESFVKRGEIWKLGNHRLMCGDSTKKEDVERLMNGEKADMVFTDPPYGMNLDTDYSKMKKSKHNFRPVHGDDEPFYAKPILDYFDYCQEVFLWGADYYLETLERDHSSLGSWIVWDKRQSAREDINTPESLDKVFGSCFELCWSKTPHKRDIARIVWCAGFGEGKFEERTGRNNAPLRIHPTQKPIGLGIWFFDRWGKQNDLVADLFLGSGSTLIACEKTNRRCFACEIDPNYCSVAIKRWEDLTGKKAVKL